MRTIFILPFLLSCAIATQAQQFIGLPAGHYTGIQAMPANPAWVNSAANGTEVHVFSANILAGTNAYRFEKDYVFGGLGQAIEGIDYYKDRNKGKKHFWGNVEAQGPSVSFELKKDQHLGFFTRSRQVVRAGNVDRDAARLIGDLSAVIDTTPYKAAFKDAGFTTHTFAEVGATYGRVLFNNYNRVFTAGITVKYVIGLSAGSVYSSELNVVKNNADSLNSIKGDVTIAYSDNVSPFINNDFSDDISNWANRGGGGNLAFDLGVVYKYYPQGNPNNETPYLYSIAASITDIGSVTYRADTGSGQYTTNLRNRAMWQFNKSPYETLPQYLDRMVADTLGKRDEIDAFRVGLPTALRVNFDYNLISNFWVGINILLNMRGSSQIYNSGYVSTLNFTPRYQHKWLTIALPMTYSGYKNVTLGTIFQVGPFYFGSASVISTLLAKQMRNVDGFAGISLKLQKPDGRYIY